jgi:3-hydroxyacyl-CoA dehydrogenase
MGHQIALQGAVSGYTVYLIDSDAHALEKASQKHDEELSARRERGEISSQRQADIQKHIHFYPQPAYENPEWLKG